MNDKTVIKPIEGNYDIADIVINIHVTYIHRNFIVKIPKVDRLRSGPRNVSDRVEIYI